MEKEEREREGEEEGEKEEKRSRLNDLWSEEYRTRLVQSLC